MASFENPQANDVQAYQSLYMIKLLKWEQSKTSIRLTFNIVGIDKVDKNDIALQVSKKNLKLNLKEQFLKDNGLVQNPPFEINDFFHYIDAKKTMCQRKGEHLVVTQKKKDDTIKWACLENKTDNKENEDQKANDCSKDRHDENKTLDKEILKKDSRPQLRVLKQNNLNSEQASQLFDIKKENQDKEFEKDELVGFHQPSPKSSNNKQKQPFKESKNNIPSTNITRDMYRDLDQKCDNNPSENRQNFFSLNFGHKCEETYYNEQKRKQLEIKQFERNRKGEPETPRTPKEDLSNNNSQNLVDELMEDSVVRNVSNKNASQVRFIFLQS